MHWRQMSNKHLSLCVKVINLKLLERPNLLFLLRKHFGLMLSRASIFFVIMYTKHIYINPFYFDYGKGCTSGDRRS